MKAMRLHEFGGPEVLQLEELDIPKPLVGQVLIKVKAIGVNFADVNRRKNKYVLPIPLPYIPGSEVAGEVVELGANVQDMLNTQMER